MQQEFVRRSNAERSEAMRAALMAAARRLFIEKGYAETATPDIVAAAGVTRGALYHHFADKRALFEAVVRAEAATVAGAIEAAAPQGLKATQALRAGGAAFLDEMAKEGRTRLLLLDGPAVLGRAEMDAIDAEHGTRTLREGLAAAMRESGVRGVSLDAVTAMVSAAYDRAALAVAAGGAPGAYLDAIGRMIDGVLRQGREGTPRIRT